MTLSLDERKRRADELPKRTVRRSTARGIETRAAGDVLTLRGYASTFDQPYDMGWYTEVVRSGAFSKTLGETPDVQLLINHEGLPLARTKSGTLTLEEDDTGLLVIATLDERDPDVKRLAPKMKRGDVDEMSFAFWTLRQQWSPDYEQRDLLEVSLDRGDVSVVAYGANPTTSASIMRSMLAMDDDAFAAAIALLSDEQYQAMRARIDAVFADSAARRSVDIAAAAEPDSDSLAEPSTLGLYIARARALAL